MRISTTSDAVQQHAALAQQGRLPDQTGDATTVGAWAPTPGPGGGI